MAGETVITVVGNLTADPELRSTQQGRAVANFSIASTPRNFDRQANEWKDGDPLFLRCSVWQEMAEHVAGTLTKGMRVIAQGRLRQRSYQDREGNQRTAIELEVDEIGPSLRYATAQVTRANSQSGGQQQQQQQQQGNYGPPQGAYGPPQGQMPPQQGYPAPQGQQQAPPPRQQQQQQPPQGYPAPQQQQQQMPPQQMPPQQAPPQQQAPQQGAWPGQDQQGGFQQQPAAGFGDQTPF